MITLTSLLPAYTANILGIILILSLYLGNAWKLKEKTKENRILFLLLLFTFLACIADPLAYSFDGMDGTFARVAVYVCNSWLYIDNMLTTFTWVVFLSLHLNGSLYKKNLIAMGILSSIGIIIIFINLFTPVIFSVNEHNIYSRCSLYWLYVLIAFVYIIDGIYLYHKTKRRGGIFKHFPIWLFIFPIVTGIIVQSLIYGFSLIWSCVAISVAGIFVSLQNETIFRDELTGLNNRRYFDTVKDRYFSGKSGPITGIMLDLNHFKSINDNYGHAEGDAALGIAADILRRSVGDLGTIIRYAGDEFIILLNTQNDKEISRVMSDIEKNYDHYNKKSKKPYDLTVSMGYHKMDLEMNESINDFMNEIDGKMYESKMKFYRDNPEFDRRLAFDHLTGLHTRRAFFHIAKDMMSKEPERHYSLIISDIESFKLINQRYGEEKADELLKFVGGCLKQMNSTDAIFARYSGDQFAGIIRLRDPMDMDNASPMFENLQRMYDESPIGRFEIKFGIYDGIDPSQSMSTACDRALMALRTVKHQYGKVIAKYTIEMEQQFAREQLILSNMQKALDTGQFQVFYQPKHDLRTGKIIGAEALIRWIDPELNSPSPGEFIPIFEKSGFISQADHFILKTVCANLNRWSYEGIPIVPISVNTSRHDILSDNFYEQFTSVMNQFHVDPNMLHMEITESVYIEDYNVLIPFVQAIRDAGIQVELDDFGAGFSSLGILAKLPLDIIKLDMSFIRDIEHQSQITESVIQLSHNLGYKVVAEGVETQKQLDLLKSMNCDYIQGYYYSRPLPENQFINYLKLHC